MEISCKECCSVPFVWRLTIYGNIILLWSSSLAFVFVLQMTGDPESGFWFLVYGARIASTWRGVRQVHISPITAPIPRSPPIKDKDKDIKRNKSHKLL